jgi:hypothetical protein
MEVELYQRIVLNRDVPNENLYKGDIAWLIDYVDHPLGGGKGAILEVFNILGDHVRVAIVPISAVSALSANLIPAARWQSE